MYAIDKEQENLRGNENEKRSSGKRKREKEKKIPTKKWTEREATKFFPGENCKGKLWEKQNQETEREIKERKGEKKLYLYISSVVATRYIIQEIHVCSSLDLMTVIILAKEHERAHILPSFNSIYVFKKLLCAFCILIQIYIKTFRSLVEWLCSDVYDPRFSFTRSR